MKKLGVMLALAALGVGTVLTSAVLAAPNTKQAAVAINVATLDFKFKLSKTSVPKGSVVTFNVTNKGSTAHDFDFTTVKGGTKYIAKGQKATLKLTFKKAGSFRFVCTVPGHIKLGMAGKFKVT